MKVLLAENENEVREVIVFLLESLFHAQVTEAVSGNQAIAHLQKNADFDVVISDYNMPDGSGGDLFKFLLKNKISIPFVLCSSDGPDAHPEFLGQKLAGFAKKPFVNEALTLILRGLAAPAAAAPKEPALPLPGFCRIRLSSLLRMSALACDIYLRLSQEKYVKVAHTGDLFEQEDFDRYRKKGLEYLYLPRESADFFLEKLTREILALRNVQARPPSADSVQLPEKALAIVHELSLDLGFTPEVQALAKANVALALTTIQADQRLGDLLQTLVLNKDSYISAHSIALAHVACGIAAQMQWHTGSTLYKLALASFLHDITLRHQELAQLRTSRELERSGTKFSQDEHLSFLKHAEEASQLAAQLTDVPPDVDAIILQHHEMPDGSGFPHHLGHTRIFPLSAVFIVAHDIVTAAWRAGGKVDMQEFLLAHEGRYNSGTFKKIAMQLALQQGAKAT